MSRPPEFDPYSPQLDPGSGVGMSSCIACARPHLYEGDGPDGWRYTTRGMLCPSCEVGQLQVVDELVAGGVATPCAACRGTGVDELALGEQLSAGERSHRASPAGPSIGLRRAAARMLDLALVLAEQGGDVSLDLALDADAGVELALRCSWPVASAVPLKGLDVDALPY